MRVIPVLLACCWLPSVAAQVPSSPASRSTLDLGKTVLPITDFKLKLKKESIPSSVGWTALVPKIAPAIEGDFGTGFCVDPECRLIGTNYHVAAIVRPRKIKGEEVIQRYLATGPDDEGATLNDIQSERPLKYNLMRDLAIFELRHPLPHYHGVAFSLDDPELDQGVDIYAYPTGRIAGVVNPIRSLVTFHGAYKGETKQGFLAFEYSRTNGEPIRGGASGGLVIDGKTQKVVGVLSRVGLGKNGKDVAQAVPIRSLADFLNKVQPWQANKIFPTAKEQVISPNLTDLYPKFQWPTATDSLQHRPDEPREVKALRDKAQSLADSMRNFLAVQTFAFGSGGTDVPVAVSAYEVQVVDGFQRFRDPETKKEFHDMPFPPLLDFIGTGGEWSALPQMVGNAPRLNIHQFDDIVINGRRVKVFQYRADIEDDVCRFNYVTDYLFFRISKIRTVRCYGEVWTDDGFNILRISEHFELSGWKDHGTVVTYGWLRLTDQIPRLIPLTIYTEAAYHKKVYWCRGMFTNYRVFTSTAKIVASDYVQSLPP